MSSLRNRLERAVISIYTDVEERALSIPATFEERVLWKEFSCCVLSSQVPYPLSVAAAEAIDRESILHIKALDDTEDRIVSILKAPLFVDGAFRRYRFPASRGRQLAAARVAVTRQAGTLGNLLEIHQDPAKLRSWLVDNTLGMGPKQASMFLRNCGVSYDLAVLDRHVLEFMAEMGLCSAAPSSISKMSEYRRREDTLRSYASSLGAAVGLMDWAIWIVMRMFKQKPVTEELLI
ncbi:DNA lyase (plasmid) [Agrobacterium sp. MA01]|uniref:8-oxoguanine DNA glycosylase n=1 Tax=Agrobacterium sp. MA01 TaxID=2664893 RepID=UPI00129B9761|nr:DNA lyase [Agrobacterium sp. MA01]QGG93261.1 DNA lyase [Agrobacterium sp. MA01]